MNGLTFALSKLHTCKMRPAMACRPHPLQQLKLGQDVHASALAAAVAAGAVHCALMFSRVCRPLRSCGGWALAVSTGHTVLTGC